MKDWHSVGDNNNMDMVNDENAQGESPKHDSKRSSLGKGLLKRLSARKETMSVQERVNKLNGTKGTSSRRNGAPPRSQKIVDKLKALDDKGFETKWVKIAFDGNGKAHLEAYRGFGGMNYLTVELDSGKGFARCTPSRMEDYVDQSESHLNNVEMDEKCKIFVTRCIAFKDWFEQNIPEYNPSSQQQESIAHSQWESLLIAFRLS